MSVAGIARLGIIKEMQPHYVATFSEKPQVLEGHPFVVEAGVSLGGAEVRDAAILYITRTVRSKVVMQIALCSSAFGQ